MNGNIEEMELVKFWREPYIRKYRGRKIKVEGHWVLLWRKK